LKHLFSFLFVTSLILLIFLGSGCQQSPSQDSFYFVQLTDTHWPDSDHFQRTRKIVEAVNNLPMEIEFVIHTGDITMERITDANVTKEGIRILNRLDMPVHYIPGNHDILAGDIARTTNLYKQTFGDLNQTLEYNGVVFLLLYSDPLIESALDARAAATFEWLKSQLKAAGSKPVVVVHHGFSVLDFYHNKFHKVWPDENQQRWTELLNSYNVKAVITGHFHRDEHHWLGDVPVYVCPPVAGYWGRQATYRIYQYKDGKLSYRTRYIE
jgi:3',5'-cyclic AMP phosphodiesterase CpdA